ncbi:MAG: transcription elongation factor NusA [Nitrososphaeria archaeon]
MKLPICLADAKIGILCPRCEARLERGEITSVDVDVSFILAKAAKDIPLLDDLTLVRAREIEGDLVLILGSGDARRLLSDPTALRKLKEYLHNDRLWITEEGDDRRFIEYLLHPLHVLTLNTVWLPDGSKTTRVLVAGRPGRGSGVDLERAKRIIKAIRGLDLEIRFEKVQAKKRAFP